MIGRKHCGTTRPGNIKSSSNQLYIKFKTDSSVTRSGFAATFNKGTFKSSLLKSLQITNDFLVGGQSKAQTFLVGVNDVGGKCPSPTYKYNNECCCANACCWNNCRRIDPPKSCLNGVPNAQWVYNREKQYYQAVRNLDQGEVFMSC